MNERILSKLTSVRAIVTFLLVLTACIMVLCGKPIEGVFGNTLGVALTFYFTRSDRRRGNNR